MPHGNHVTAEQCQEMRRLAAETSYSNRTIGHEVAPGDQPFAVSTVWKHLNGWCSHESDD